MGKNFPFTKNQFNYLFERVEKKFRPLLEKDKLSVYFGHGSGHDPYPTDDPNYSKEQGRNSLKYAMLQDIEVKKYIARIEKKTLETLAEKDIERFGRTFLGDNLEKKRRENKGNKENESIAIQENDYGNIYLLYIGVCSFEESLKIDIHARFIVDYEAAKEIPNIDKVINFENQEQKEEEQKSKDLSKIIAYKVYYYSHIEHKIRDFDLTIDYNLDYKNEFHVTEQYFHDNESSPIYEGCGYIDAQKLKIDLNHIKNKTDRVNIILDSGKEPWRKDLMIGSIMGVSAQHDMLTMSTEVIVLRIATTEETQIKIAKRYLFLNRKSFVINSAPLNIFALSYQNNRVRDLDYLVGHYRLWQFNEDYSAIIESYLCIDEQLNAICKTQQYGIDSFEDQIWILKPNNRHSSNEDIFITVHSYEYTGMMDTNLISLIILKPFKRYRKEEQELAKGVSIEHGYYGNLLIKRAIIFQKLSNSSDIKIGYHSIADILERVNKGNNLKKMLDTLIDSEQYEAQKMLETYYNIKNMRFTNDLLNEFDSLSL